MPEQPARTLTVLEHDSAWHAIEHATGQPDADTGTVLAAVLHALGINPPSLADEQADHLRRRGYAPDEITRLLQAHVPAP